MIVSKFGITLETIQEADLEMMRVWRNAEHVRSVMQYQSFITKEQHAEWYRSLNKKENIYFVIKSGTDRLGIVNLKKINRIEKTAEAGIFIGVVDYLNTVIPFVATIIMMEFAFDVLGLDILKAKIDINNTKALLFNKSLGYTKSCQLCSDGFEYYSVTKKQFLASSSAIINTLNKISDSDYKIVMTEQEAVTFFNSKSI